LLLIRIETFKATQSYKTQMISRLCSSVVRNNQTKRGFCERFDIINGNQYNVTFPSYLNSSVNNELLSQGGVCNSSQVAVPYNTTPHKGNCSPNPRIKIHSDTIFKRCSFFNNIFTLCRLFIFHSYFLSHIPSFLSYNARTFTVIYNSTISSGREVNGLDVLFKRAFGH